MLVRLWGVFFLLLLGVGVGVVAFSGMGVAPVVFKAPTILSYLAMTPYDAGLLMGRVFVKANMFLNLLAVVLFLDVLVLFAIKRLKSVPLVLVLAHILNIAFIFLFSLYYTPAILKAQAQGRFYTTTKEFMELHAQSELLFKALFVLLCFSFLYRAFTLIPKPRAKRYV